MADSSEVAQVLQDFADAWSSGDGPGLDRLLSKRAIRVIGSDPQEYWGPDPDDVSKKVLAQVEAMGGQMKFSLNSPDANQEGNVGWVADQITVRLPDGTEVPFRFTGVLRNEDGWKFVQAHFSLGVPNEEAVGEELST